MLHKHLTLEKYELAVEEDTAEAIRLRAQAAACNGCHDALNERPLDIVLSDWRLPPGAFKPVDWEGALRIAITAPVVAPSPSAPPRRFRPVPMLAALALLGLLLIGAVIPAAASAQPDSGLYPVRGAQENAQVAVTGRGGRAQLESKFASTYISEAKSAADKQDAAAYRASMDRFGYWGKRLREDAAYSQPATRASITSNIASARAVAGQLKASGADPAGAQQAEAVLNDAQNQIQTGDGQHQSVWPTAPGKGRGTPSAPVDQQGPAGNGDSQDGSRSGSQPPGGLPPPLGAGNEGDGAHGDG
jgi:hypothetical protein